MGWMAQFAAGPLRVEVNTRSRAEVDAQLFPLKTCGLLPPDLAAPVWARHSLVWASRPATRRCGLGGGFE